MKMLSEEYPSPKKAMKGGDEVMEVMLPEPRPSYCLMSHALRFSQEQRRRKTVLMIRIFWVMRGGDRLHTHNLALDCTKVGYNDVRWHDLNKGHVRDVSITSKESCFWHD